MTLTQATKDALRFGLASPIAADEVNALIGGVNQQGNVFYCDPIAGNDNRDGSSKATAFKTEQAGIDATAADNGDVIVRMRGYHAPTATVNFNKQGITMIAETFGMNFRAQGEFFGVDSSNTDGPAARITKGCTIIGIGFMGAQASGDDYTACVQIDGSGAGTDGYGTHLLSCRFTNWDRAAVEHGVVNQGAANVRIEECYFVGGAATNIFDAGILHDESSTGGGGRPGEIDCYHNRYEHCEYAHEVVSGSRVVNSVWEREIMGFQAVGDVWVKYLKLNVLGGGGAVHGAHICNNNFGTGIDTGTFSHSLANLVTEGYQFSNNHYGTDLANLS